MSVKTTATNAQKILSDLKKGDYKPIYLLMGEEAYYIDLISDYIEKNVLSDGEKDFNQTVLYGLDTDPLSVVSIVKRFPMMAERQVVIVKEAQSMKGLEKLLEIVENPVPTTLLVLAYKGKTIDKRTKVGKALTKNSVVFTSPALRDYQTAGWISDECARRKIKISKVAAELMAQHIGEDMERIINELNKLKVVLPEGAEITPKLIEEHIGISKDFNVFEFQNALGEKKVAQAFKIAKHFGHAPKEHPLVLTTGALHSFFTKIYQFHHLENPGQAASVLKVSPYFVKDYGRYSQNYPVQKLERIFGYLKETDLKSKGVDNYSTDEKGLLQELVYKILN